MKDCAIKMDIIRYDLLPNIKAMYTFNQKTTLRQRKEATLGQFSSEVTAGLKSELFFFQTGHRTRQKVQSVVIFTNRLEGAEGVNSYLSQR